jgi:hypothetical protein
VFWLGRKGAAATGSAAAAVEVPGATAVVLESEDDEEEEEEEEGDKDEAKLSPFMIKLKAVGLLLGGVLLVTIFSDPMVRAATCARPRPPPPPGGERVTVRAGLLEPVSTWRAEGSCRPVWHRGKGRP